MLKKNYVYLSIAIIATGYSAVEFMFFPELIPKWLIRIIGGLFLLSFISYFLDIQKLYLTKKINKVEKKIIENTKLHCTKLHCFECENYMPAKVHNDGTLYCSKCGLVHI